MKKNATTQVSRRNFLKSSAILSAGFMIVPRHVLGGQGYIAPSDTINLGFIGTGRQSRGLGPRFMKTEGCRMLAACDVDASKLERFSGLVRKHYKEENGNTRGMSESDYHTYRDFRELIARDDIDAVIIATPDHWHAIIAIEAMKDGKDVYCEKPLAYTVKEGRAMVKAARKYERVLQTGSMQRSRENFRHACELVRNGYIGDIKEVKVSVGGPPEVCNLPEEDPGRDIQWDMWIGPSAYRPYHSELAPPIPEQFWPKWRYYKGFGGGMVTDWGAHMFDIAQWALGMDHSGPVEFLPPAGDREFLTMKYENGIEMTHEEFGRGNAVRFIGSKGTLDVSRSFLDSNPASLAAHKIKETEIRLYKSDNHYADFLQAMRNRSKPICDVEIGHRTSSVCNIVNICYELNRPLQWNPEKEKFVKDKEASKMLGRKFRAPWKLKV